MSRATNIIAGNSKITSTTLHADWCTRIMGFDVIGHHGETEQRHGCICKSLGQSHMYPFRYTYMMAMVTRLIPIWKVNEVQQCNCCILRHVLRHGVIMSDNNGIPDNNGKIQDNNEKIPWGRG